MENLYRLENHVIVYEKEKAVITFIKDLEVDAIFFENETSNSFQFIYDEKIYNNSKFKIDKIEFDPNGKYLATEYISMDTKFNLKEIFRYIKGTTLERYYILSPRFAGKLSQFKIFTGELKVKEQVEIISPGRAEFRHKISDKVIQRLAPKEEPGIFVVKGKEDSMSTWYYNQNISAIASIENKVITYTMNYDIELEHRQELVIGGQYYKFYEGNYIEALESISKFYTIENKQLEDDKLNTTKYYGPIYYASNSISYNKAFSDLIDHVFLRNINSEDIKEWLRIEKAIKPRNCRNFMYGLSSSFIRKYPKDFLELSGILAMSLGDVHLNTILKKLDKKYPILNTDEILKKGRIYFDLIQADKNILTFIKKYNGKFYVLAFNLDIFPKEANIKISHEFVNENMKLKYYKVRNILKNRVEATINDLENVDLLFDAYEVKIMSFDYDTEEKMSGTKYLKSENEEYIAIQNSFYEIIFLKKEICPQVLKNKELILYDFKTNLILKKDKRELVNEDKIINKSKHANLSYNVNKKNYIDFEIETFDMSKSIYFEFKYSKAKCLIENNKMTNHISNLKIGEKLSIVGAQIFKVEILDSNFENIKVEADIEKMRISTKVKDNLKYNLKFRIYMI